jgi:hypothetical protein
VARGGADNIGADVGLVICCSSERSIELRIAWVDVGSISVVGAASVVAVMIMG